LPRTLNLSGCIYLPEKTSLLLSQANAVVSLREYAANAKVRRGGDSLAPSLEIKRYTVAQPQRLEIRFLGTTIRAEGIAGIIGAIAIISVILTAYFN
jgi:hypothetical protein